MYSKWYCTTKDVQFKEKKLETTNDVDTSISLTGETDQKVNGFGGCFNELSWIALNKLSKKKRDEILDMLFEDDKDGLQLNFCRMPIGASDYAKKWYSHNEVEDDFGMEHFSIDRDREYLLPFIKEAFKRNQDIVMFASPWSPPTWMKNPPVYNYGTLKQTNENLQAYALYFAKFIESYKAEGININQVHIQNEPCVSQKFPSCEWTGSEFANFIGNFLGPCFKDREIDTEIWLGTINGPEPDFFNKNLVTGYNDYANIVLHNKKAAQYVKGVGYQWAGKYAVQQTHQAWPELGLMQTENECGEGNNSWEYARYVFDLFRHYFSNGVDAYIYWNMVLESGGESTWGWTQNSLFSINGENGQYHINHEYYVMKHFSSIIKKGAIFQKIKGPFSSNAVVFKNPNGELVLVALNPFVEEKVLKFNTELGSYTFTLESDSINTIIIKE